MSKNKAPHKKDKRKTKSDITNSVVNFFNKNSSESFGIKQVAEKLGFKKEHLFNPKINIYAGAWLLKRCFNKHGVSEDGTTCYNGRIENNTYGYEVLKELKEVYKKEKHQS